MQSGEILGKNITTGDPIKLVTLMNKLAVYLNYRDLH